MNEETSEAGSPVRWTDINGVTHSTQPGTMRTFRLKSDEAYEALCGRGSYDPWIRNGALPREPRVWGPTVIVEPSWAARR